MSMHSNLHVCMKKKRYGCKPAATEKTAVEAKEVTHPWSSTCAIITSPSEVSDERVRHIWNCQWYDCS